MNTPVHVGLSVQQFLTKNILFPRMKKVLKERHFADVEEVKQGIRMNQFRNCCEPWGKRPDRCIVSHGEGFEGD